MRSYLHVLRTAGVAAILVTNIVSRLPVGMLALAAMLATLERTGSFAAAGAVTALVSIGQAVSGPLMSSLAVRVGVRKVVVGGGTAATLATVGLALSGCTLPVAAACAFGAGLTTPPVLAIARASYPTLLSPGRVPVALSLDASAQETIWIASPVMVVAISAAAGAQAALLTTAAVTLAGAVAFAAVLPATWKELPPPKRSRDGGVVNLRGEQAILLNPLVLITTVIGALLIAACAAAEASVLAHLSHDRTGAGIVLAVFSAGSLTGGLAFGTLPVSARGIIWRLTIVGGGIGGLVFVSDALGLGIALFIAGLGVATALAARTSMIATSLPRQQVARASGWLTAGQLAGGGAGMALSSLAIETWGAAAASVIALCFLVAALATTALGAAWLTATPSPQTIVRPPSSTSTWPVTKAAHGDERNTTASATTQSAPTGRTE